MPSKPGRNDPCPCGSGKKYKRCCLEKDQALEQKAFAAAAAERAAAEAAEAQKRSAAREEFEAFLDRQDTVLKEQEQLADASNTPIRLIKEGKLDEAEAAARDLLQRYPDVHDGYDRLGMVYEARGEYKQAAEYYRKVIEFIRAHPQQYEPEFEAVFHRLLAQLDPPADP